VRLAPEMKMSDYPLYERGRWPCGQCLYRWDICKQGPSRIEECFVKRRGLLGMSGLVHDPVGRLGTPESRHFQKGGGGVE
jgi:hypothetical protein